jgi:hypothetical protein
MKIPVIKESFGPWRIEATREVDLRSKREDGLSNQDYYLQLGALYEMERKPANEAEKLFWSERDKNGKLVRGPQFRRNVDIPADDSAAVAITRSLEAAGYSDVVVSLREVSDSGKPTKEDLTIAASIKAANKQARLGLDATATVQEVAVAYRQHRLAKEREAKASNHNGVQRTAVQSPCPSL